MIQSNVIEKLSKLEKSDFQILTVYLGTDTLQAPSSEMLLTQFHSLIHKKLNTVDRTIFKSDIQRIEKYLEAHVPSFRSLVFFSAGKHLWEVASLEFGMPAKITIDNSPDTTKLVESLQKHSKYLVILVDREKARMFTVEQGEITDQSEAIGSYVPPRVKATGRENFKNQTDTNFRHNEVLLKRHIDSVAKAITKFTKTNNINFVIIGGHAEMFRKVADSLPASLQSKIIVGFVTDVNAPLNKILRESKKIAASIS